MINTVLAKNSENPLSFSFPIMVYWEDTDAGGVVYHASYVRFLERARTEWLRHLGWTQTQLRDSEDLLLVVREMRLDFRKPARLDDALIVKVSLSQHRRASLIFEQAIWRADELLLQAQVRIASLSAATFRPRPLPAWFIDYIHNAENNASTGE